MEKDQLLHSFRKYLTAHDFGPGDKLPGEIELAEQFKVSRGDIREVLMHFSHLGVLTRIKKRGTFICNIPYEHLHEDISLCFQLAKLSYDDLKESRIALELALAPLLIARINRETLQKLRKNVDEMEKASKNPEKADHCDRDFHLMLFEAAHNSALKLFSNVLHTLFRKEFRLRFLTSAWVLQAVTEHRGLLESLEKGDMETLKKRICQHLSYL